LDTLHNINTFIRVARLGSFSAAARDLRAAPSVITKRISQLEREVGTRLITRSTRGLTLTAAGEQFLPRFVRLIAERDEIFQGLEAAGQGVAGLLRIQTPPSVTSMFLGKMLNDFQVKYPRVDIDLVLMERSADPLEEGHDLAIGAWPVSFPNVVDVPLCPYDLITVCAPRYLENREPPRHPTALVEHQCLTTVLFKNSWAFNHTGGAVNVEVHSRMQSSDSPMVREAACMGMGIAILPRFLVDDDLKMGRLVQLLEDYPCKAYWLKAWVPRMKMQRPATRALVGFLKDATHPPPWEREKVLSA
jgi:DNA-binding transcriptional LysR family regulator